ncbi:MAG: 2-dehydropantoate 2-reductase [Nevskia sp.]|nr:2-dehydropantoate 2-reductase [Nevskia sp.]
MQPLGRICIFGAGSVGCYIGGRLLSAGARVRLIGRARLAQQLRADGLKLSDLRGASQRVPAEQIDFVVDDANAAADAGLVLITVKSAATEQAGQTLASVLKPGTTVISFQNGLGHAATLQRWLPQCVVLAGMVPFNVLNRGGGAFHQGSAGQLMVQGSAALRPYLASFAAAGLAIEQRNDMPAVQWGKLLLNLNNSINALCGLPLKVELSQRSYRRCCAAAQYEAIQILAAAGQAVAKLTPLPVAWLPRMLELPDFLFRLAANRMLAIDPLARSSMWEDLEAGRSTEVDWLNGEIVRLAVRSGRHAPINQRLLELIRAAERGGRRDWPGDALLAELVRVRA